MTRLTCIVIAFVSLLGGCAPAPDAVFTDGDKTWVYRSDTIGGWRVYLEKSLVGDHKLVRYLYKELRISFEHIEEVVPAGPVKLLKNVNTSGNTWV